MALNSGIRNLKSIKRIKGTQVIFLFFLTFVSLVAVLPIIYIVNDAFKPARELFLFPPKFFVMSPTMQNFTELMITTRLSIVPISRFIYNSFIVTFFSVSLTTIICLMCAYALSKHTFPGKKALFSIIVFSLMFVSETVQITRYILISSIGIIDTYLAHILPHLAMPVGVFLMKQFIDQIPNSLLEAAKIDGANETYTFAAIIVPLTKVAAGTVMILSFQLVWPNAETSDIYMRHDTMKTLPFFVKSLTSGVTSIVARRGAYAAGGLLLFLPNFILFYILKKSMIDTLMYSGIK